LVLTDRRTCWVVDDDTNIQSYLSDFLDSRGYGVDCLDSGEQVLRRLASTEPPSVLLLDIRMPRMGGLEVLAELERLRCSVPSIVLSGVDQIPTVVRAIQLGASDYLVKPLDTKELEEAIARVLEKSSVVYQNCVLQEVAFATSNKRMLQIQAICDQVAEADVPVLILGESGVGKEILARYLHVRSGRREPFVKVNCAALPADLLESELFGHERGAFTGAQREKPGKFELAGHGTILLDEIGEMSPLLQAKLLHILQDGEYTRLGGTRTLTSEARIIAATNRRLSTLVTKGEFREDLFFRLNVITIEIPPLRERPEDILSLCDRFVEQYRVKYKSQVKKLPEALLSAYLRYRWPGNVRQLENAIRRYLLLPNLEQALAELQTNQAQAVDPDPPDGVSLKNLAANAAERVEKELVFRTLNEVNWNRRQAAQRLNICYKSLLNKLHRWSSEQPEADGSVPGGGK
jgi:DNA-binding NtrC family response regulator